MGEEIEIYILKKLNDAIGECKDSSEFNLAARFLLPKLHKDFTELKELIEKKRSKIKRDADAAAAAGPSNAPAHPTPAVRDRAAATNVTNIPDVSKPPAAAAKEDSKVLLPPGGVKKSEAPGDDKETGAPADDKKEKEKEKDTGAPWDAKELDASTDVGDEKEADVVSGDKKEIDDVAGDKKESNAPWDATSAGDMDQHESDTRTTRQDESEISPCAGDGEKEDNASKTATLSKTSSPDESDISPVTDDGATDHKSKKDSGDPPADKSSTTDASTKTDSNTVPPVNEENLLREQLYYLNNVLTEWQMITKRPFSYSTTKDLSNALNKIKQDLKPETTNKTEESSHSGIPPTASSDYATLIRTTPQVVEFRWSTRLNLKTVYGFEDKILSLERLLVLRRKDTDAFKAFGIHGMAGVGKTTLCQSIFSRPKVTGYFFPRIWVCLSKQKGEDEDNRKEVVKRMLRCLGIDDKIINKVDEKQSRRGLLFALRLQLTGKRYFIVLDDAHNADEWFKMPDSDAENDNNKIYEQFSYGLPKECGGTVIVTSRVEQVVKNMVGDEENLRCIEPLMDQDTCWNIFKNTVEEDGTPFPDDLNKLRLEIVKRCDGLPLAAKLLGQIKHKELRENPALAGNQRAAVEAGNQQAAVE